MDAHTITAICVLVVFVFATGLAVWSAATQRKHLRLSVRPIATVPVADFEHKVAVYLANKGLGPMKIKTLRVADNSGKKHDNVLSHMPELKKDILWSNFYDSVDGATLENGKRFELLLLEGDPNDLEFQEYRDDVHRSLKNLSIRIDYEDLYGIRMGPVEEKLSFFGRHETDTRKYKNR